MKLYIYEHCPFCSRARMAFGLKEVPVELSVVMANDAETPVRKIGRKALPILERDDGSFMGESLDIVHYVDHLGEPVFDGPGDPALDNWGKDAWPLAAKLFIPRFTKGDFAELATAEAREAYRLREAEDLGDLEALMTGTDGFMAALRPKLEALAPLLDGRETVGISDILLWPILRSLSIVRDLPFPGPVRSYAERLEQRSGVPLLFDQAM